MNTAKRAVIVTAISALTLTPAVAVAEPIQDAPIPAGHAVGGIGSGSALIEAVLPVGEVDPTPEGVVDAAQAAGLTPEQAAELGKIVEGLPAFGGIIGNIIREFQGGVQRILDELSSLIPGIPGFPPPPNNDPAPPTGELTPTLPPVPTPTSTATPKPTPTSTATPKPTPTSTATPGPTATTPTTAPTTSPTPSVPTTTSGAQPVPTIPGGQPTPTITPPNTPACGLRSEAKNPDEFAQGVFELINDYRRANGLHALKRNLDLERAAENWSNTMAITNIPAHNPNLRDQVPDCTFVLGENVGAGTGAHSPQRMFDNWRNSPGHNENLLRPEFTDIGIGIASNGVWTFGTMVGANGR